MQRREHKTQKHSKIFSLVYNILNLCFKTFILMKVNLDLSQKFSEKFLLKYFRFTFNHKFGAQINPLFSYTWFTRICNISCKISQKNALFFILPNNGLWKNISAIRETSCSRTDAINFVCKTYLTFTDEEYFQSESDFIQYCWISESISQFYRINNVSYFYFWFEFHRNQVIVLLSITFWAKSIT